MAVKGATLIAARCRGPVHRCPVQQRLSNLIQCTPPTRPTHHDASHYVALHGPTGSTVCTTQ